MLTWTARAEVDAVMTELHRLRYQLRVAVNIGIEVNLDEVGLDLRDQVRFSSGGKPTCS